MLKPFKYRKIKRSDNYTHSDHQKDRSAKPAPHISDQIEYSGGIIGELIGTICQRFGEGIIGTTFGHFFNLSCCLAPVVIVIIFICHHYCCH